MYNEIIESHIGGIGSKDGMRLNQALSQALTDSGYPDIVCLGVYHQDRDVFEGAILDGMNMSNGPIERFEYHFETQTFTEIQ